jgi:uncharacterized HAD superfamily protein
VGKLTIGLDIDGVIVDYAAVMLPLLSEVCRRPVTAQDIYTYDITECLNIDDKAAEYVWQQTLGTDLLIDAPPVEGAVDGLSALDGHEICIVTGRPATLQKLTEEWLSSRNIRYDGIVFDRVMNKMLVGPKFDVFVEDFLEEALVIAEAGVFTILFNQPWNHSSTLPQNCRRVYNWPAIVNIIDELQGVNN